MVDIPGNDKVRKKFFDAYKNNAKYDLNDFKNIAKFNVINFYIRALIFVIDSTSLQKDLKDVALYIYSFI